MADKEQEILFKRKLDRSPDSKEFFKLEEKDRRVVGHLRNAMEGVHQKVSALKDEVEEKELEVTREQALRKAAEARLDQLVDMYGDPAVNKELQERLPRAKKGQDIREKWRGELGGGQQEGEEGGGRSNNRSPQRKEKTVNFEEIESQMLPETKKKKSRSRSAGTRKQRHEYASEESDSGSESGGHHSRHPRHSFPPGYPGFAMPPYPAFYPPMYSAYPTPPPQNMLPGQAQMMYAAPPGGNVMAQTSTSAQTNTPNGSELNQVQGALQNVVKQEGSPSTLSGVVTAGAGTLPEASLSAHQVAMNREQTKQISLLLAELDAAKSLNKQLQDKLLEVENEVETQKIKHQTLESETEEKLRGKIAAMVEEIYAAQKQRDEAMMNRMRIANEERDVALTKLKHLERSLDQLSESSELASDVNLKSVLSELHRAETGEDLSAAGKQLVEAVNTRLQRQRRDNTEEMRAVLEERDRAVSKAKRLEAEVLRLQRLSRGRDQEKEQQATTQARLLATQQERDIALSRCQKLEEEIQTLQVYYSLHKSLSQEANLRNQFSDTLENMEGELKQRGGMVEQAQRENSRLAAHIQSLVAEKNNMEQDLVKSQYAQKEAMANQEKLERLVNVLRRKINGLGTKAEE